MRIPVFAGVMAAWLAAFIVDTRTWEGCEIGTVPQRQRTGPVDSAAIVSISADGRFVAFSSYVRLLAADTNDCSDIYVLDRSANRLTLETSMDDTTCDRLRPSISTDGRLLVFDAVASLGSGKHESREQQIWLRDRSRGTTTLLSVSPTGEPSNRHSLQPVISGNGNVVVFESAATNLVPGGDANGEGIDVYAVELFTRTITRVSLSNAGVQQPVGESISPSISADGRHVAFTSTAALHPDVLARPLDRAAARARREGRPSSKRHVFVRDLESRRTTLVSRDAANVARAPSYFPSLSGDGRRVAFVSSADLVHADRNRTADVYVHDLDAGVTTLVSRTPRGRSGNGHSTRPAISSNGQFIAYQSAASDLECVTRCTPEQRDINLVWDVFLFNAAAGLTVRVSRDDESGWMEPSRAPAVDATAHVVVFSSRRPLGSEDRDNDFDLFVRACGTGR